MKKIIKLITIMSVIMITMGMIRPLMAYAAGEAAINISEEMVSLDIGETTVIVMDYSGLVQGFEDLAAISSDSNIAVAAIADAVNGQACLAIVGNGTGTATVAVYSISNAAIVDYVVVRCGMAADGQITNRVDGTVLTTIYNDRIINYNNILTGKNGAQMAVTGLVLERESGIDCLKISGELLAKDTQMPGMTVFYANFYDAAGGLIKRQAVYTRDPQANNHLELKWYIPDGCVRIVIE